MNSKQLREKRAVLVEQARAIYKQAEAEKRELTAEETQRWDQLMADVDKLKGDIDRLERLEDEERALGTPQPARAGQQGTPGGEDDPNAEEERAAFNAYLRFGAAGMSTEQRAVMQRRWSTLTTEQRAMAAGTAAAGGYTVPEDFYKKLEDALKQFGGMRQARTTIVRTNTGATLPMPTSNDTTNKGAILAENTQVTDADPTFGVVNLDAYMYTSKLVRVSLQLLQDSAFDLASWLAVKLGERIGRATNEHDTTGTGTSQPNGVVTAATLGKTGATGQTTSVTYNDLVDLEHSVDPAYRLLAEWMWHDSTLKALKKLVDSQNRPLWLPGIAVREPDTLMGYRYVVNQDVAQMAASAKSILFGDFSKYHIRDVLDVTVLRLTERYADFLQVGFLAFSRHDADLVDAGTNPIKFYQNSAT